jgi:membrane protease YdiL (CAAX protease family)
VEPARSISRLGFSRWYERRLIEAHAWFISAFICTILIAACMEELTFRGSAARLLAYVALVVAASVIAVYGMFRYQRVLGEAERLGERATCPACGVYARFKLFSASSVRCRKCNHEWRLLD